MKMWPSKLRSAPALLALLAFLMPGCILDKEANRGSVVDNEVRVGTIRLADGTPAANARVRVFPVDHVPDSTGLKKAAAGPVFTARTDSKGRYKVDSLPKGEYNILGDLDGEVSYSDSIFIAATTDSLPSDTLGAPGSLSGIVGMEPNHDTRTVTVQVLGTYAFANVDGDGRFRIEGLAGGNYRLRLVTTIPEYTPLFASVKARSGRADTLPDTLHLPFTGVPVVRGLKAVYDTLNGVVGLSWNKTRYPRFGEYWVFRDRAGTLSPSLLPIARTTDTAYSDRLDFQAGDAAFEYRVKIRSRSEEIGKSDGFVLVEATSPASVRTSFRFRLLPAHGNGTGWARSFETTTGDSVALILHYDNPGRSLREVAWSFGEGTPVRVRNAGGKEGEDTLFFRTPDSAATLSVRVRIMDEAGTAWTDGVPVEVLRDEPVVTAFASTPLAGRGDTVVLRGQASDRGLIVRWEFSVAGAGFVRLSKPETSIVVPKDGALPGNVLTAVLRATDEDGNSTDGTIRVSVSPWRRMRPMPTPRADFAMAVLDGMIYVAGGRLLDPTVPLADFQLYDPAKDEWRALKSMPTPRYDLGLFALGGRLYAAGGRSTSFHEEVEIYDPASDTWTAGPRMGRPRSAVAAFAFKGKGYVIEGNQESSLGNQVHILDPAAGAWEEQAYVFGSPGFESRANPSVAVLQDRVATLGDGIFADYFPERARIERYQKPMPRFGFEPALAPAHGKLLAVSGNQAWLFEKDGSSWAAAIGPIDHHSGAKAAVVGGRIYLVGGRVDGGRISTAVESYDAGAGDLSALLRDEPVINPNRVPEISGLPPAKVLAGYEGYEFAPIASDPDFDALRFRIQNLPAWATFDSLTGLLKGSPRASDTGTYAGIRITVTDGKAEKALPDFLIRVLPAPWLALPAAPFTGAGGALASSADGPIYFSDGRIARFDGRVPAWTERGTYSTGNITGGFAAHSHGGATYMLALHGISPHLYSYDTASGALAEITLPYPVAPDFYEDFQAFHGGKLYSFTLRQGVRAFDLANRAWETLGGIPTPCTDAGNHFRLIAPMAASAGKVFMAVTCGSASLQRILTLNLDDMSWTESRLPQSDRFEWRTEPGSVGGCSAGGRFYAIGGFQNSALVANGAGYPDVLEYDPVRRAWSRKSDMITARGKVACGEVKGRLWVAGGKNYGLAMKTVEIYDPALDTRSEALPFRN